jgi:chromatin remodeling complex protein RSC6
MSAVSVGKTKRTKKTTEEKLERETLERETLERETLERETLERETLERETLERETRERLEKETSEKVETLLTMKERFDRLILANQEDIKRKKEEIVLLKDGYKQYVYELKQSKKRKRSSGEQKMNGFSKPLVLVEELYDFLSVCGVERGEEVPRTRVTSCIHTYIKEKELGNKERKIEFFPDERLGKLLGPARDLVDETDPSKGVFYNKMRLQQYLSQYYPKK